MISPRKRFGVIGLGSMGRRRLRCLAHWHERDVVVFDTSANRREAAARSYGSTPVDSFAAFWDAEPDAVFISTPPDRHTPLAVRCAERGIDFFTEASVIDDYNTLFRALERRPDLVAAPSACYRFNPVVSAAKTYLSHARNLGGSTFLYHDGQYLPDWHPYEDYRTFYVAQEKTAAAREMVIFDLVWLTWLFGDVATVSALSDKVSSLEIGGPDLYLCQCTFSSGARGSILVDVVSRSRFRDMRVIHEDFTLLWSLLPPFVKVWNARTKKWRDLSISMRGAPKGMTPYEWTYELETRAFLDAVHRRKPYPYSFADDRRMLALLKAMERSARTGRRISTSRGLG